MIITRTPFRFSLGGGGTDLPAYYSKYGGFVFSAAINKYMFINVNIPIVDDLVRVKYKKSEIVDHPDKLQHGIAREALKLMEIDKAIEIISIADIPAGTGLGSSSSYAVGVLNALHALKKEYIPLHELAEEACNLEINILGKPIGKQDQYIATFGGLAVLNIEKDGDVHVSQAKIDELLIDDLNRNLIIFYTGTSRNADKILSTQSKGAKEEKKNVIENMHQIKEIGFKILEAVESGNITDVGLLFDKHWQHKKNISSMMSNSWLDEIYELAKQNGALGGKVTGAGGGGFFLFYVEENHTKLRKAMKETGLREMRYRFDFEGTKVLVNLMDGVR